jgi:hypothetical protein
MNEELEQAQKKILSLEQSGFKLLEANVRLGVQLDVANTKLDIIKAMAKTSQKSLYVEDGEPIYVVPCNELLMVISDRPSEEWR